MTLIQLRSDDPGSLQDPVNMDLILTFQKTKGQSICEEFAECYKYAIKFTFVDNYSVLWEYLKKETRDKDYEYLIRTIVGVPDL